MAVRGTRKKAAKLGSPKKAVVAKRARRVVSPKKRPRAKAAPAPKKRTRAKAAPARTSKKRARVKAAPAPKKRTRAKATPASTKRSRTKAAPAPKKRARTKVASATKKRTRAKAPPAPKKLARAKTAPAAKKRAHAKATPAPKKRARAKAAPATKKRARAKAIPAPKKRRARPKATPAPKKRARPKVSPVSKRTSGPADKRTSGQQLAAISRATARLEAISQPKTANQHELFNQRRAELVESLRRAGRSDASIRAILGWIKRRHKQKLRTLAQIHTQILGREAHGSSREDWYVLRAHVTRDSRQFRRFVDEALERGFSYDEAVDAWFSPEGD